jgi:hypothetical protein
VLAESAVRIAAAAGRHIAEEARLRKGGLGEVEAARHTGPEEELHTVVVAARRTVLEAELHTAREEELHIDVEAGVRRIVRGEARHTARGEGLRRAVDPHGEGGIDREEAAVGSLEEDSLGRSLAEEEGLQSVRGSAGVQGDGFAHGRPRIRGTTWYENITEIEELFIRSPEGVEYRW